MARIVADRVLETSTTTGTASYTLLGAVTGFRSASAVCVIGDTFTYYAEDVDTFGRPLGDWETGLGTYSAANTLTRTTIYSSSNSNTAVNWAAGTRRLGLSLISQASLGPTTVNGNLTANIFSGTSFNSITELSSTNPAPNGAVAIGSSTTVARSDHVHQAQTTITGNAGTATKLVSIPTTFSGTYPMLVSVSDVVYSHTTVTYNGTTNTLTAPNFAGAASATNLTSGTVPDARISGSYTGMVNLTGSGSVDFSKFLGLATDTVTTPSFTWTGDTTTGIYRPAASEIAFSIAGVQRGLINSSGLVVTGEISAPYIGVENTGATNGYGISLYGGASNSQPTYGLMFQGTATFGTYGPVTSDWATYFTMNQSAGRGWIFKSNTGTSGNVVAISVAGAAQFASTVTASNFISNVATGTPPFTVSSTTVVPNLNADLLDGLTSGQFARSDSTFFAGHHAEGRILANAVLTNDFANARLRGSVFTITNATLSNSSIDAMFDGTSNFCSFTGTGGTFPLVIEFTLPRTLSYGAWIGIGFGNSSWRCNGVKIETFTEGVWVTAIDTSTNFSEDILVNIPGNSGIGTSKVRYTLTNPNSGNIRIAHLWGYNYNSSMWSELMMPKSGGSVYGGISASGNITGNQLISNIAIGTSPLVVTSTTVVPNLNADLLDGLNSSSFLRSDVNTTYSGGVFTITTPTGLLGSSVASVNTLQIYQSTAQTDAFQTFHIAGDRAVHFGLDGTTNDLFVGGWSLGAVKHKIWHAGNDGTGSGLDADLLDGKNIGTSGNTVPLLDGTNTWSSANTFNGNLNVGNATMRNYSPTDTDIVALVPGSTAGTFIKAQDNAHLVIGIQGNDVNDGFHIINTNNVAAPAPYAKLLLSVTDQTFTYKGNNIWHAGNDGTGSGLDADLLDGNHASDFALSGHTHSYQAADGDLLAIGGLVGTSGLLRKTAADTWSLDTAAYSTTTGTVTSVGGTGTVSGLTLSGSVTTSGNLTLGGTITGFSTTTHNHTLDSLSNITITSNTIGEILKWNGTAWINNTLAEAGIQPTGSYLTAEADTLATVTNRGNIATSHLIVPSGEGNSFGFWSGSTTYSIAMGNTAGTYQYGPVTDYSIKMSMGGGAGRGFTWGQRDVKPIAALNSTTGDMQIAGSFSAASKSFLIKHPTKPDLQLRYGSLESPYHGVRLTGEGTVIKGKCSIKLPDYIHGLCKQEGAQVQITNNKHGKVLWVEDIIVDEDYFTVACETGFFDRKEYKFYWTFTAIRKDISDLEVEC